MITTRIAIAATASFVITGHALAGDAVFTPLGHLPDSDFSQATSVSNDGQFVGGHSALPSGFAPIIWDGTTPNLLTLPAGFENGGAFLNAISGDGQTAVAIGLALEGFRGIRWDTTGTPHVLNADPGTFSSFNAINLDGSVAAGVTNEDLFGGSADAVIWTSEGGLQLFDDLPNGAGFGSFTGVNDDGTLFVGFINDGVRRPVTWTSEGGFDILDNADGQPAAGIAVDVSMNGNVIVGALDDGMNTTPAFWIDGDVHVIDLWPGYLVGESLDATDDGAIVVGNWREDAFSDELGSLAFYWDKAGGVRPLQDMLADEYGLDIGDWTLNQVSAISADGRTFVGTGLNPDGDLEAYKVVLPGTSGIPGDLDDNGVVDGADLAILLGAWGACPDCDDCDADLDGNCEVDGADLAILLGNWG